MTFGKAVVYVFSTFWRFYEELKEKYSLSLYLLTFTLSLSMCLSFTLSLSMPLPFTPSLFIYIPLPSLSSFSLLFLSLALHLTVKLVKQEVCNSKIFLTHSFINLFFYLFIFFPLNAYLLTLFVLSI